MLKQLSVLAASAAAAAVTATPASAAEKEIIPLDCGSAGTFTVATNGNGDFTPGLIEGSSGVVVPISFQNFHFMATAADGTVLLDELDPAVDAKGKGNVAAHNPRSQVTCTFSQTEVLEQDEEGFPAGTTLTFSGEVTGFLTPAKK